MKIHTPISDIQCGVKQLAEALGWVVITHKEYLELRLAHGNAAMGAWHRKQKEAELTKRENELAKREATVKALLRKAPSRRRQAK